MKNNNKNSNNDDYDNDNDITYYTSILMSRFLSIKWNYIIHMFLFDLFWNYIVYLL